jgi:chromate transport protein ChrA
MAGVNAAVVGLLGAALVALGRQAIGGPLDALIAMVALIALLRRVPVLVVVFGCLVARLALGFAAG